MPNAITCRCRDRGLPTTPGCSLRGMPQHQRRFLDSVPGSNLVGVKTAGWISHPLPANDHCLTEAEWVSLIAYTTTQTKIWNGAALNAELRSSSPSEEMRDYRDTLKDALGKLPIHQDWVHRRTMLPDEVLEHYWKGAEVTHAGFTCASESIHQRWPGPHHFWIKSRIGRRISHYSAVSGREEVLFGAGTRFCVTRRSESTNCIIFDLREI